MAGTLKKLLVMLIAIIAWFALLSQLYLIIVNRTTSVAETIIRYFSFFTILTNSIVAMCATGLLLSKDNNHFFSRPKTLTATTIYIVVVGMVYNLLLRKLWSPTGLQWVTDELLHTVIPLLFVLYWALYVNKRNLQWRFIPGWLVYPAAYAIIVLIRGAISGFYPYPFINVTELGYPRVLINCGMLVLAFLVLSIIAIAIGKLSKRVAK